MIQLAQVSLDAGDCRLREIDLRVASGEHVVLSGSSGVGKTTLLEAIVGLRPIRTGAILIRGRDCRVATPAERGIGYVPQDGVLFTTMSVGQNLAYALRARSWRTAAIKERVTAVAVSLGIEPLLDRGAAGLSGGEARRVALGRAIAFRPDILLLDEPTTGLDRAARDEVYAAIERLRADEQPAILQATHELAAEGLADRVLRLEGGRLIEVEATPKPSIVIAPRDAS